MNSTFAGPVIKDLFEQSGVLIKSVLDDSQPSGYSDYDDFDDDDDDDDDFDDDDDDDDDDDNSGGGEYDDDDDDEDNKFGGNIFKFIFYRFSGGYVQSRLFCCHYEGEKRMMI